jgi:hypothetical protein
MYWDLFRTKNIAINAYKVQKKWRDNDERYV